MGSKMQIDNLLVEAGIISVMTLERSLKVQKGSGKRLGAILREMGLVTEEEVLLALAKQCQLRVVKKFAGQSFPKELLELVPARLALEKFIFPLKVYQDLLAVATLDPFDHETFRNLAEDTGMKIHLVLATREDIVTAIRRHYTLPRLAREGKQKIVLIDPSSIVTDFLKAPLEKEGYEVFVSNDGIDGLKLVYSCCPDLILCDLMMPRMDSYMFMYALKTHPETIDVPVILMSSKSSTEEEHRAHKAGFADFIGKPAMPVRVLVCIKKALARAENGHLAAGPATQTSTSKGSPPRSLRNYLRQRHGRL